MQCIAVVCAPGPSGVRCSARAGPATDTTPRPAGQAPGHRPRCARRTATASAARCRKPRRWPGLGGGQGRAAATPASGGDADRWEEGARCVTQARTEAGGGRLARGELDGGEAGGRAQGRGRTGQRASKWVRAGHPDSCRVASVGLWSDTPARAEQPSTVRDRSSGRPSTAGAGTGKGTG